MPRISSQNASEAPESIRDLSVPLGVQKRIQGLPRDGGAVDIGLVTPPQLVVDVPVESLQKLMRKANIDDRGWRPWGSPPRTFLRMVTRFCHDVPL